jgi:predicted transport protein
LRTTRVSCVYDGCGTNDRRRAAEGCREVQAPAGQKGEPAATHGGLPRVGSKTGRVIAMLKREAGTKRRYWRGLLLLELVRASTAVPSQRRPRSLTAARRRQRAAGATAVAETGALNDVWESLKTFLLALGDDVHMKELEHYVAFRRLRNFVCVTKHNSYLQIWTRLDPSSVPLEKGFTRDVSHLGHAGTGNLEVPHQEFRRSGAGPAAAPAQLPRCVILPGDR